MATGGVEASVDDELREGFGRHVEKWQPQVVVCVWEDSEEGVCRGFKAKMVFKPVAFVRTVLMGVECSKTPMSMR